jgi:hypothetical protein
MLPLRGRDSKDFDEVASRLAEGRWRILAVEFRAPSVRRDAVWRIL